MALDFSELWVVDPEDPNYPDGPLTLIEIDLNETEREGCESGWTVTEGDVDVVMNPISESIHAPGYNGDAQASFDFGNSFLRFKLAYSNATPDVVRPRLAALSQALQRDTGVIALSYKGETELLYYDYVKSTIPQLLHGQRRGLWKVTKALLAEGIPIDIEVKPWPRIDRVNGTDDTMGTTPLTRAITLNNPGDFPSEMQLNITPDQATDSLGQVLMGIRTHGDLTEWKAIAAIACSTMDPKIDTALDTSIVGAQNTDALVTDFTTQEDLARRVREELSFSPGVLDGTHEYVLRYKINGGAGTDNGLFNIQLRYGFFDGEQLPNVGDIIPQDWDNIGADPGFTEVPLGRITVPEGAELLIMEIWASRESGDTSLAFDMRTLVPADYWSAYASPPGWRIGEWGEEIFDADVLEGTGALVRSTYRLNADDEIAHPKPASTTGRELVAGLHAFEFRGSVREPTLARVTVGMMEVLEAPSTVLEDLKIKSRASQLFTVFKKNKVLHWTISAVDAAAEKYIMRVRQDVATLEGRRIQIAYLIHSFVQGITDEMRLEIDSFNRRTVVESNDVRRFDVLLENDPPMAPPGDFGLVVIAGYLPVDAGYKDIDERYAMARSIVGATSTVSVDIWPRVQ